MSKTLVQVSFTCTTFHDVNKFIQCLPYCSTTGNRLGLFGVKDKRYLSSNRTLYESPIMTCHFLIFITICMTTFFHMSRKLLSPVLQELRDQLFTCADLAPFPRLCECLFGWQQVCAILPYNYWGSVRRSCSRWNLAWLLSVSSSQAHCPAWLPADWCCSTDTCGCERWHCWLSEPWRSGLRLPTIHC